MLTGDRPTGKLHLGHYLGSLKQRVALQEHNTCFILLADLHMLTTNNTQKDIAMIKDNITNIVLDYLSVGINPTKTVMYIQSEVKEVFELSAYFGNYVTIPRLQRLPSIKEMAENAHIQELPFGLLGYPVLQSADILLSLANLVPVGKDNEAHVELTREIVRKFNNTYDASLPEPEAMIGDIKTLVGTDGAAKMSKSLNNAIYLSDTSSEVEKKVMRMYTDPNRTRADIPGEVEKNPVFVYHRAFNTDKREVQELQDKYSQGKVGDVEVKQKLARALNMFLEPLREKREQYAKDEGQVEQILYDGTSRMKTVAMETISYVRNCMGLRFF